MFGDLLTDELTEPLDDVGDHALAPFRAFLKKWIEQMNNETGDLFGDELLDDATSKHDLPDGVVPAARLDEITGGCWKAELALTHGHVSLSDIPEELRTEGREADRAEWLAARVPEDDPLFKLMALTEARETP